MKRLILTFCVSTFFSFSNANGQSAVRLTGLQSDHLENPIGIDNPAPRLSWKMEDSRQGARQRAYRVLVGKDSIQVADGTADMWDIGKDNLRKYIGYLCREATGALYEILLESNK